MFQNKFVACIKSQGKILREFKDEVRVPFGSEYSILLKNLNTVRALATVTIDGEDVSAGHQLVIPANGQFELSRFIRNGNLLEGNRFKFIERTAGVENGRGGIQLEDGLIRVEFAYERVVKPVVYPRTDWYTKQVLYRGAGLDTPVFGDFYSTSAVGMAMTCSTAPMATNSSTVSTKSLRSAAIPNEAGVTVPGSVSNQQFSISDSFSVESETFAIVLRLVGEAGGQIVAKPVTVAAKPKCITCGKQNKATSKFCSDCGTSLILV